MSKDLGVVFSPSVGERLVRSKARIKRLRQAITEERAKKQKDKERIVALTIELDLRINEIKEFAEEIL